MLNRVPLGNAGGIVGDGDVEGEAVGELSLQLGFPSAAAATVATTRVGENQQLAGARVLRKSFILPPVSNGMRGESRGVVRDANDDRTTVVNGLINALGNGDANSVGQEIVIIDSPGFTVPTGAGAFKVADQFAFLGINADDGHAAVLEALA